MTSDDVIAHELLPHLATRLLRTPLMLHPSKLDAILAAVGPRFGLDVSALPPIEAKQRLAMDVGGDLKQGITYALHEGTAIIPVRGTMVKRTGTMRPFSGMTGVDGLTQVFRTALHDPAVERIVLHIDSPGGEVAGAFDLADEVYAARGQKPIVAAVDEAGYSAAYLLASAADRVYLPRTGGVGSIGIVGVHVDTTGADAKLGLKYTIIKAGEKKVTEHAPLPEAAASDLQAKVDDLYALFTETVARNRGIPVAQVRDTEAGTFMGKKAVTAKLADGVQTFDDTVRAGTTRRSAQPTRGKGGVMAEQQQEEQQRAEQERQKVVSIDQARTEGAAAESARVMAILDLGVLAGFQSEAQEMARDPKISVEEARTRLLTLKAQRGDAGGDVRGQIQHEAKPQLKTAEEVYDWRRKQYEAMGRTRFIA